MIEPKAGSRLRSAVCETEVVVIKNTSSGWVLECGGAPMVLATAPDLRVEVPEPPYDGGTTLGKRYVDTSETIEVLCTKPGSGSLAIGTTQLSVKSAKPLPASD